MARIAFPANGAAERAARCFLHGGAAHAHWFDRVIPALSGRFHVISLDQRATGRASGRGRRRTPPRDIRGRPARLMDRLGWARMTLWVIRWGATTRWLRRLAPNARRPSSSWTRGRTCHPTGSAHARARPRPPRLHQSEEAAVASSACCRARRSPIRRCSPTWRAWGSRASTGVQIPLRPGLLRRPQAVDCWPLAAPRHRADPGRPWQHSPVLPVEMANAHARDRSARGARRDPGAYHHLTLDTPRRSASPSTRSCAARCESRYPGTPLAPPLESTSACRRLDDAARAKTLVAMVRAPPDAEGHRILDSHHGFDSTGRGRRASAKCGLMRWQRGATLGPNPTAAQPARDNGPPPAGGLRGYP